MVLDTQERPGDKWRLARPCRVSSAVEGISWKTDRMEAMGWKIYRERMTNQNDKGSL